MPDSGIRRVLVAIDSSELNHEILQTAMELASRFKAELNAVYIEDINLLRMAELPLAREVVYGAVKASQLTPNEMERSLQLQSARLRRFVEKIAQTKEINISFNVLRGDIANELSIASQECDLLVMGKSTQIINRGRRIGSVTRTVLASANSSLLLIQHGARFERPVAVFYNSTESCKRAMDLALELVEQVNGNLLVIVPANLPGTELDEVKKQLNKQLNERSVNITILQLTENTIDALLETITNSGAKLLLTGIKTGIIEDQELQTLVEKNTVPIILAR
ncbi:MAG: universal stress protein [Thioalkalispiraceae bacterium]|jgi:nucleotide-binding universal stress UspA family protein